jgi:hypothetical protein
MSLASVIARLQELDQSTLAASSPAPAATPTAASPNAFSTALASQTAGIANGASPLAGLAGGSLNVGATTTGQRLLSAAQAEVGVAEQPPGSNDGTRIADYRSSTAGSGVGPWCAYFTSWAAAQAGSPLGEAGQGFGSVSAVYGWAQRTGRAEPAGNGYAPQAGDLIVWGGEHIGIVESVDASGQIHTIEGNSSNAVTRRTHSATGDGATGYVRMS